MAEVHAPAASTAAHTDPVASSTDAEPTTALPEVTPAATEPIAPVTDSAPETTTAAAVTEPATTEEVEETKIVEPITEGQLSYKGPGLLKSLIPSKKEFWLSDAPVSPQGLDSYLRGEKPEISYPVVAWASQTGKGLLFFNKKGHASREHPHGVIALYDVTDLKKQPTHEITFNVHGHAHTLKAANDTERDGWYISLEKAIELGKVEKETLRETEGYKAEIEKLNKPTAPGASLATTSVIQPPAPGEKSAGKKSTEVERAQRPDSDVEEEGTKKTEKSRSTSRGLLSRLKGKKEEVEAKHEEKKEEKEIKKVEETAPVVADVAAVADEPAVAAPVEETPKETETASPTTQKSGFLSNLGFGKRNRSVSPAAQSNEVAPVTETAATEPVAVPAVAAPATSTEENAVEGLAIAPATTDAAPVEEKPKASKRNSIFGFIKSPAKEKTATEAELKPEVPVKDEAAPQLTDPVAATETPAVAAEPVAPVEASTEDATKTDSPPASKRNSVFGNLGRRASKALNRVGGSKKDSVTPATETASEEKPGELVTSLEVKEPATDPTTLAAEPTLTEASAPTTTIGDVVPEAVNVGQPQTASHVAATA